VEKKPTILVPSPNVAEDHQTKNAMELVQRDAALMVPDNEVHAKLLNTAFELLKDDKRRQSLSENIEKMATGNATELIVDEIKNLIKNEA
jgi:UDP-N-acetylglucosamine--N-acetylmuramyl-(pentapeptide) pyrophosphoryl-undecaprenol N-acetylglucosamine transferase